MKSFDLAVVGGGIVGLAHALAAARRGLSAVVIERDPCALSASVRNFGFITVTGQEAGVTYRRARRSLAVWHEVAPEAGIDILQQDAVVVARRPEALAVLEEFAAGDMGRDCVLWNTVQARKALRVRGDIAGALASPYEIRIEARDAPPKLARWLEARHGVTFLWETEVLGIDGPKIRHARGEIEAGAVIVAPGANIAAFAPEAAKRIEARVCTLQMLRVAAPGFRLPSVVMSDLSLLRYGGFAVTAAAERLRARLQDECAEELEHGVHLIVAQSADGSLVVGDSHHYAAHAQPFASAAVEALILGELHALFNIPDAEVTERWLGHYPVANVKPVVSEELQPRVRLVTVTNGLGMSTAFAIGEETLAELFG